MYIQELYELSLWVEEYFTKNNLLSMYSGLHSILLTNTRPNQPKQPFSSQKENLMAGLINMNTNKLNKDQIEFLDRTKIAPYIGFRGAVNVEDLLFKNSLDIATSAEVFGQIIQTLSQEFERFQKYKESLKEFVQIEPKFSDDEVMLRVHFSGKASISNIVDLKTWSNSFYDIARGIVLLENEAPESVKVIGTRNGSIIIELAVVAIVAKTLSSIILEVMKVADRVLELQKKSEEIKALKLSNKKIASDIDKEIEHEKTEATNRIKTLIVNQKPDETDGEKVTALERSITKLIDFIEKGGEIDCFVPEIVNMVENQKQLFDSIRENFKKVVEIENKIKLLEGKNT